MLHAWSVAGHELFKVPLSWAAQGIMNPAQAKNYKYEATEFSKQVQLAARGEIDFLVTDKPPKGAKSGAVLPIALTSLSVVYRIDGYNGVVKLRWPVLKEILDGKIVVWGDPKIVADNPNLNNNATPVVFVHSKEVFGALQIFGAFMKRQKLRLTKPNFGVRVTSPKLVAATVKNTNGAIGLIDYPWQQEYQLRAAMLQNKSGQFIAPSRDSLLASAEFAIRLLKGRFSSVVLNPEGSSAYPIFGFVYLVATNKQTAADSRVKMLEIAGKLFTPTGDQMLGRSGFEALKSDQKKSILNSGL